MEIRHQETRRARDAGYALIEMGVAMAVTAVVLLVVAIGLRTLVVDSGLTACESEQRDVARAVELWFASNVGGTVPPTGDGPDRYERTLVAAGWMRAPSINLDLADDGSMSMVAGSSCQASEATAAPPARTEPFANPQHTGLIGRMLRH